MTIKEYYSQKKEGLTKNQSRDFAWLLTTKTGIEPIDFGEQVITLKKQNEINACLKRLINDEPLGYILGNVPFLNAEIKVTKDVLIPRLETEQLAEFIVEQHQTERVKILDLCTGSGCLAIALSLNLIANVVATDISENALSIAKQNALANFASVDFIQSDMFENIKGQFDIIVCNPPYISEEEYKKLPKSVRDNEPKLALDGGRDGLDFYRVIAKKAPNYLAPGGVLYLEVGDFQADAVADILNENFANVDIKADYFGFDRFVIARK